MEGLRNFPPLNQRERRSTLLMWTKDDDTSTSLSSLIVSLLCSFFLLPHTVIYLHNTHHRQFPSEFTALLNFFFSFSGASFNLENYYKYKKN